MFECKHRLIYLLIDGEEWMFSFEFILVILGIEFFIEILLGEDEICFFSKGRSFFLFNLKLSHSIIDYLPGICNFYFKFTSLGKHFLAWELALLLSFWNELEF